MIKNRHICTCLKDLLEYISIYLLADRANIHYIDYEQSEHYYTLNEFPATVEKKVINCHYLIRSDEPKSDVHGLNSGEVVELLPQLHEGALVEGRSKHGGNFLRLELLGRDLFELHSHPGS